MDVEMTVKKHTQQQYWKQQTNYQDILAGLTVPWPKFNAEIKTLHYDNWRHGIKGFENHVWS